MAAPSPDLDTTKDSPDRYTPVPRWVKVSVIIAIGTVLALVITRVAPGPHRPGMHGAGAPASSVVAAPPGGYELSSKDS